MKVALVTQPLMANYGGILQNYALQQVLKELGHEPVTLDYLPTLPLKRYIRCLLRWILKGAPYRPYFLKRPELFDSFVRENISTMPAGYRLRKSLLKGIDAIVVGSDQVWRPIYNRGTLRDMFLDFAAGFKGCRIAYAASFGTEKWEVSEKAAEEFSMLARKFRAISVREPSGIRICKERLGVNAVLVPDPVRLLPASAYLALCENIPACKEPYIAAYILDDNEETARTLVRVQKAYALPVRRCTCDRDANLTIPEWIAMLRDASVIVTDSYHGAIMANLFGKPCEIIENFERGRERFAALKSSASIEEIQQQGRVFLANSL